MGIRLGPTLRSRLDIEDAVDANADARGVHLSG
jgi:hypothetical protein